MTTPSPPLLSTSEDVKAFVKESGYKELFMDLLGKIRTLEDDVDEQFKYIMMLQLVLPEIQRKAHLFWKDGLSLVYRTLFNHENAKAIELALKFGQHLSHSDLHVQCLLVSYWLHVASRVPLNKDSISSEIAIQVYEATLSCCNTGVGLKTVLYTLKFREEVSHFTTVVMPLPKANSTLLLDHDDIPKELKSLFSPVDTACNMMLFPEISIVSKAFMCEEDKDEASPESLESWNVSGIIFLLHIMMTGLLSPAMDSLRSDHQWCFDTFLPYCIVLLDDKERSAISIKLLSYILKKDIIVLGTGSSNNISLVLEYEMLPATQFDSIEAYASVLKACSHVRLFRVLINAMVRMEDEKDRYNAYIVLEKAFDAVKKDHRFILQSTLAKQCPYANVAGLIIDRIRKGLSLEPPPPQDTLYALIQDLLKPVKDSELGNHADIYLSTLSLYRFILLKFGKSKNDNEKSLTVFHNRISVLVKEASSAADPRSSRNSKIRTNDLSRLLLLDEALESIITLLRSV